MTSTLAAFLLRRGVAAMLLVAAVSSSAFFLVRLAPGDPTAELVSTGASPATLAAERARLGLDRPVLAHFASWAMGLARFDLGESTALRRPVAGLVIERAARTAWLAGAALLLAVAIGLPLGIITGAQPRGWAAAIVTPLSIALVSCPPIVAALGLLLLAASTQWFSIGAGSPTVPLLALALPLAAMLERLQSQATTETLAAPDLVAASARGVPYRRLVWVHAARRSLRPVLGIFGIIVGSLFSGSLVVEWVTAWPGLGRLMYTALVARDIFLVAGCALAGALLIAVGNLVADLLRACVDPRTRGAG